MTDPSLSHYVALGACVLFTTTAQLMLKMGAQDRPTYRESLLNPWTILGYGQLVLVTVLAVYAMQAIELKVGTAWSGLTYMLVFIFSSLLLKEEITRMKVIGCLSIAVGIAIFSL